MIRDVTDQTIYSLVNRISQKRVDEIVVLSAQFLFRKTGDGILH